MITRTMATELRLSPDARKRTIAAIWAAARQLRLSKEELYRLVYAWTDSDSISRLDDAQLVAVVETLRKMGFERKDGAVAILQDDSGQVKKIKAIWLELHRSGAAKSGHPAALNAYAKRMTGVNHVNWLTPAQANVVIEGLKQWRDRVLPSWSDDD